MWVIQLQEKNLSVNQGKIKVKAYLQIIPQRDVFDKNLFVKYLDVGKTHDLWP